MDSEIKLYHGTSKESAIKIIENHEFIYRNDDELRLGYGIYFYDKRQYAIDWFFIRNEDCIYDEINDKWSIVEVNIIVGKNNILDFQDPSNILKLNKILEYYDIKLDFDLSDRDSAKSTIINYLTKKRYLEGIDCVTDVIPMNIKHTFASEFNHKLFKKVYCIRNANIIKEYYDIKNIEESEFLESKLLFA